MYIYINIYIHTYILGTLAQKFLFASLTEVNLIQLHPLPKSCTLASDLFSTTPWTARRES